MTYLIRFSLIFAIILTSSVVTAESSEQLCEKIKTNGFDVNLEITALDIFNVNNKVSKQLDFKVFDTSSVSKCDEAPNSYSSGNQFLIKIGSNSYPGFYENLTDFKRNPSYYYYEGTLKVAGGPFALRVHHTVWTDLLREIGFESFESGTGAVYPDLLHLGFSSEGSMPFMTTQMYNLGLVQKDGRLYEISIRRSKFSIAETY